MLARSNAAAAPTEADPFARRSTSSRIARGHRRRPEPREELANGALAMAMAGPSEKRERTRIPAAVESRPA